MPGVHYKRLHVVAFSCAWEGNVACLQLSNHASGAQFGMFNPGGQGCTPMHISITDQVHGILGFPTRKLQHRLSMVASFVVGPAASMILRFSNSALLFVDASSAALACLVVARVDFPVSHRHRSSPLRLSSKLHGALQGVVWNSSLPANLAN